MNDIFQIDEKFDLLQDENLKYIQEVSKRKFHLEPGMIFIESNEMEKDYKNSIKKLQDTKNQSWGILQKEVSGMFQELGRLIRLFESFYTMSISENEKLSNLSPQKIHYVINRIMIRIRRLVCVLDPDYSIINFKDKKTGNNYKMIKGYWINDNGERVRSISRNIGNTESSINELTMKLFKMNSKNVLMMEPESGLRYKPDLILFDGKTNWIVETKLQDIDNFIKTYVMFESWKIYKEEYELII
jgi:hypothetical protein